MNLNQLSVYLENKPGALKEVCQILAENNIDISALSLADTSSFGILRLILKEWEKARDILLEKGFAVKITDVFAVEVDNQPGGMCKLVETLDKYQINVDYIYAFVSTVNSKAVIIMRLDSAEKALELLKADNTIKFISKNDIFAEK
ncbi:MAG: ACT domain-containing protein [Lentisphaeria bacterium]|nr:ACT domain-containing protein [Lentisphaeria bacterium]